jgi:chloramphenicol-sensitive protein RarD
MKKGVLYAIGAYGLWGFLPIYWKALQAVPAIQILSHRFVWSFVFLITLILLRSEWRSFKTAVSDPRTILIYSLSACLLAVNWGTYIWGVNAGLVVETSLGYFINPLVSVLFGVFFLKERLRPLQWLPVGLAALGVIYLTFSYGSLPWVALILAFSFGLYGLLKKTAPLGSLYGLTLETAALFIPAVSFLLLTEMQGSGTFGHLGLSTTLLLAFTGVVTALPLLLFASAARSINLSLLGILQYIAPTCQFLLGVLVYDEPFTLERLGGFSLIWIALLIFSFEGMLVRWKSAPTTAS